MPVPHINLVPFAAELLDFGGVAPAAGKGLVWDGEGKLVAADVVVPSDLAAYATISAVTSALADKADASALAAHTEADDNPHDVSAAQVGAYTTAQVDGLISAITYSDVGAAAASHPHTAADVSDFASAVAENAAVAANTDARHAQNTDTGTSSDSFQIGTGGPKIKRVGGSFLFRNPTDTGYAYVQVDGVATGNVYFVYDGSNHWLFPTSATDLTLYDTSLSPGTLTLGTINASAEVNAGAFNEDNQPLRERYTRHWLDLEAKADLATLPATIGDQATVLTGDANDPIHRYELIGDVTETGPELDYTDVGQPDGWPASLIVKVPAGFGPTGTEAELELTWQEGLPSKYVGQFSTVFHVDLIPGTFLRFTESSMPGGSMTFAVGPTFIPALPDPSTLGTGTEWDAATVAFANNIYDTPAENLANWRRIVALDADEEIKGPIINRLVLATDDTDVAKIGEIVCVVDDLDEPTTVSYRMGDGTTKTESLPEIATVTP